MKNMIPFSAFDDDSNTKKCACFFVSNDFWIIFFFSAFRLFSFRCEVEMNQGENTHIKRKRILT